MKNIHLNLLILSTMTISLIGCKKNVESKYQFPEMDSSDSLITEAVENELAHYNEVPSNLIDVETKEGIVRLTGSINNILAKEKAVEITSTVRGVKGIINELDVNTEFVPNNLLEDRINKLYYMDPVIISDEITVKVDSGHVVLTGIVDSWSKEKLAKELAESVTGVRSVEDDMNIEYEKFRPDYEIARDIEGLLNYDIYINPDSVEIKVDKGTVTLSGIVGSLFEKSRVIADAWVESVDTVISNDLKIDPAIKPPMIDYEKYKHVTDNEIKEAVENTLFFDARVVSTGIIIKVSKGYVTLMGTVDNLRAKKAAQDDAENVIGVWNVLNRIKVRPQGIQPKNAIADNTREALKQSPYLRYQDIKIIEDNGSVYLTGEVNNNFERNEAEKIASGIPGVVEVVNNIEVNQTPLLSYPSKYHSSSSIITKPHLNKPDSKIKEDIEKELWWSPFVNEKEVKVEVKDGVATLSGTVDTELERKYAEKNAMEGGAIAVTDDLQTRFGPNTLIP